MDLNQDLHYLLHLGDKLIMFSRSWGQRSRSCSNDCGNLVNSISAELMKGFKSKLMQILSVLERLTDDIFKVKGQG